MTRKKFFLILMSIWFLAVTAYIIYGEYRLNAGQIAELKIIVHQEKSLFKEGKISFSYEINEIKDGQKIFDKNLREIKKSGLKNDQQVYVSLIENEGYFTSSNIYLSPPKDIFFIRGKVQTSGIFFNMFFTSYSIIYGIEDFNILQENLALISAKSIISAEVKVNLYGMPFLKSLTIDGNKIVPANQNEKNN